MMEGNVMREYFSRVYSEFRDDVWYFDDSAIGHAGAIASSLAHIE